MKSFCMIVCLCAVTVSSADARRWRVRRSRPVAKRQTPPTSWDTQIDTKLQALANREVELMSRHRTVRHFFSASDLGCRFAGVGTWPRTCTPSDPTLVLAADARSRDGRYRARYWVSKTRRNRNATRFVTPSDGTKTKPQANSNGESL